MVCGTAGSTTRALYELVEQQAHKPNMSIEEERYLLSDEATAQSFLSGYQITSGEGGF